MSFFFPVFYSQTDRNRVYSRSVTPDWWVVFGDPDVPDGIAANQTVAKSTGDRRFVVVGDETGVMEKLEEYGEVRPAIAALHGIFAVVIWDRQRRELWLGRDRVGGKTLYSKERDS